MSFKQSEEAFLNSLGNLLHLCKHHSLLPFARIFQSPFDLLLLTEWGKGKKCNYRSQASWINIVPETSFFPLCTIFECQDLPGAQDQRLCVSSFFQEDEITKEGKDNRENNLHPNLILAAFVAKGGRFIPHV